MENLNLVTNKDWTRLETEVLILGSGLAGLLLANLLHDKGAAVTLVSKETFSDSNTFYAQGGLAAVTPENVVDSLSEHLQDTTKSGAGLTDIAVAQNIINGAPRLVQELQQYGMLFDSSSNGAFALAREGGHSKARVLHSKDTTGKAISGSLLTTAKDKSSNSTNFTMLEFCYAFRLITENDSKRVIGADVLQDGCVKRIFAKHVVLATGGAGQIFSRTTNPLIATADGAALAYRAGAALIDLEFMQFHPTALAKPGAPAFLISEAVRGAGAVLLDDRGSPFVHRFHPDGDLATRDVVARAIHSTMLAQRSSSVALDLRPIGKATLVERFPNIIESCRRYGIDPLDEPVPVCPAAHYFMGGVLADENGVTSLPGLYAIGEVACTGLHGANRLASNSLLEAGVMAINLANYLANQQSRFTGAESAVSERANTSEISIPFSLPMFKNSMFEYASLTRSQSGLSTLSDFIEKNRLQTSSLNAANISASNILLVGDLMVQTAAHRTESRGSHFREDHPVSNDLLFARRQAVCDGTWTWSKHSADFGKIDKQSALTA